MHRIKHLFRHLRVSPLVAGLLLACWALLFLAGCASLRQPADPAPEPPVQQEVSEADRLKSTTKLIDAGREKSLGNLSRAIVYYHEAVELDPENDAAHFELARLHAQQDELDDALGFAQTAVLLSPDNYFYQNLLGEIYMMLEDVPQAIRVFSHLAGEHPESAGFSYRLATAYLYNDQPEQALAVLNELEKQTGFSEEVSITRHRILIGMGLLDEAIEEVQRLIHFAPDEPAYYEWLAELYHETGQWDEAYEVYQQLLENDPEDPLVNFLMAGYYQETGQMDKAVGHLETAFRSPLLDVESKLAIIYSFFQLFEIDGAYPEEATRLVRMIMEAHPEEAEAHLIYGDFMVRAGDYEQARDAYVRGAQIDPSDFDLWHQILTLDAQLVDFESMKKHAEQSLAYFFEQPLLFLFNGLASMQLGDYEEAASSLEYALVITVDDEDLRSELHTLLGDTYHYMEEHALSDEHYETALKINPENSTALNNLSYHLAKRGIRLEEAERMSLMANRLRPDNPALLDTQGYILYRQGRYEEAGQWLRRALALGGDDNPLILEHYGDVLYRLGKPGEALEYWIKASEAGEGSDFLEQKIKDRTLYE